MEQHQLSSDGATLALRVYTPAGPPRASVVIGGAMGVRQAFYEAFATWLAGQGYRVTSFDYRGHGDSLQGSLRQVRADLCDWARDYEAVIAHAKAQLPDQPLFLIGHSLGAQLPGLLRSPQLVDGLLSIAAGSGYWRDMRPASNAWFPISGMCWCPWPRACAATFRAGACARWATCRPASCCSGAAGA